MYTNVCKIYDTKTVGVNNSMLPVGLVASEVQTFAHTKLTPVYLSYNNL